MRLNASSTHAPPPLPPVLHLQELGAGAYPELGHRPPASLPVGLARLALEDDEDNAVRGSCAIPACVRQLGGGLRHLQLASHVLAAPLPLAALAALSGLTSLWLVDHGHCVPLGRLARGGAGSSSDSGSGSDSGSDSGSERGGAGSTRRGEEAAWASGTAGPLLPDLQELVLSCLVTLPPAFSALTSLSYLQLNGQLGVGQAYRPAPPVPDLVWRLPALKVRPAPAFWGVRCRALPLCCGRTLHSKGVSLLSTPPWLLHPPPN